MPDAEVISGYAARFGDETVIAGVFREKLRAGCFTNTLRDKPDVVMLLSHDPGRVLGRTTADTLDLREDRIGLWFSLTVDITTPEGQTALGNVRRGDVKGCSFGFSVREEIWEDGGLRLPLRTLVDVDLIEITLTAFPAYGGTSAGLRSAHNRLNAAERLRGKAAAAMRCRGMI